MSFSASIMFCEKRIIIVTVSKIVEVKVTPNVFGQPNVIIASVILMKIQPIKIIIAR